MQEQCLFFKYNPFNTSYVSASPMSSLNQGSKQPSQLQGHPEILKHNAISSGTSVKVTNVLSYLIFENGISNII